MKFKIYDYENDRSVDIELTASQWKELQAFLKELKNPPAQDYKAVLEARAKMEGIDTNAIYKAD